MGVVFKTKLSEIAKYQFLRIDYKFSSGKEFIFNQRNSYRVGQLFQTGRGIVMNKEYIAENEGIYPVYSSQTSDDGIFGNIDTYMFDGDFLTWTTDGAKAGRVSYRNGKFNCTNVCGTAKLKQGFENLFELKFLAFYLNTVSKYYVSIASGNPKLMNNVFEEIRLPNISIDKQRNILAQIQPIEAEITNLKNTKLKSLDIINQVFGEEFGFDWEEFEKIKSQKVYFSSLVEFANNIDCRMGLRFHNKAGKYLHSFLSLRTSKKVKDFIDEPIVLGKSVSPSDYDEDGEYYYIAMSNIKTYAFEPEDCKKVSEEYALSNLKKTVKKGDILLSRSGEGTIGKVALIEDEDINAIFADFTQRIRLTNYNTLFAYYYFRSEFFQYLVYTHKKGLGNNTNIFPSQIREFPIPDWNEAKQTEIVEKIKSQIDAQKIIDDQIETKQAEINKIIETAIQPE